MRRNVLEDGGRGSVTFSRPRIWNGSPLPTQLTKRAKGRTMITGRVYEVGDEVRVDIEVDGVRYEGRHGFSGGGRGKESLVILFGMAILGLVILTVLVGG